MDKKDRQNILVKVGCVLAAFSLWLYITYAQNPIKNFKVKNIPVQILNEDSITASKLAMLPNQNFTVNLTVRVAATDVYFAKSDQFKVVADLSGYVLKKGDNRIPIQIIKSPESVTVLNSESLWINIELDDLSQKVVPVKVDMEEGNNTNIIVNPLITPESVYISGAKRFVSEVDHVVAKGSFKNVNKNTTLSLPLQAVDNEGRVIKEVDIAPSTVSVSLTVKKIKAVKLSVKTTGALNTDYNIKTVEPYLGTIEIAGEESILKNISFLETEPIDLDKITESSQVSAKIILPKGVTFVNNDGTVKVKVSVSKTLTKNYKVNVTYVNLNQVYSLSLDKPVVSIVVAGEESAIKALKAEDIQCVLDLNLLEEGTHTVPVNVKLKDGIKLISVSPTNIKATISKKDTATGQGEGR